MEHGYSCGHTSVWAVMSLEYRFDIDINRTEASKGKAKIGSTLKGIGPTYMDKTGRNGIRVGDLELDNWKDKYRALANKHESMVAFYNVDLEYDLEELEVEFFEAVKVLKSLKFIDIAKI